MISPRLLWQRVVPLRAAALPVVTCAVGLFWAHHPMLLSGLQRMQWDLGDTRLVNYALEHSYRWLIRRPLDSKFWDSPFFASERNVTAYTENLLGVAPFYWPWRLVGLAPDTAMQMWQLTLSALNFASAYLLLRRGLVLRAGACALGAFLFAFGSSRVNQIGHAQLLASFYLVLAVYACLRMFSSPEPVKRTRHVYLLFLAIAAQTHACVYNAYFLVLGLTLAAFLALAVQPWRRRLLTLAREQWLHAVVALVGCALILLPAAIHYRAAARHLGYRNFREVAWMLPRLTSWFDLGPYSWVYGRWAQSRIVSSLPIEWEQRIGLGVLTSALCTVGLWLGRRRPLVLPLTLTYVCLVMLATCFPGEVTAWKWVYQYVPGASALRTICRVGVIALLPASVLVGLAFEHLLGRSIAVSACAALGVALEQGMTSPAFDKAFNRQVIGSLARQVDSRCDAFLFTPFQGELPGWKYQLDAMWASLAAGVPTVNGYSGSCPPGWHLEEVSVRQPQDDVRLRNALAIWLATERWSPANLCSIRTRPDDGSNVARFLRQSVPLQVIPGDPFEVSLTFQNVGTRTWSPPSGFGLVDRAGWGGVWGVPAVEVPKYVDAGREVTFWVKLRAAVQPGKYPFQWQMFQRSAGPFGDPSPRFEIEVRPR